MVVGKNERCKKMTVHASLFGVGAPEALVIGVVALLVFGPKGLAEVSSLLLLLNHTLIVYNVALFGMFASPLQ